MSYCVNCGVKLAPSERQCPLCDTVVINPSNPWKEPTSRPYPQRMEKIISRVDKRFIVSLASLFLIIPVIIPLVTNLLINNAITWSGYVIGASACIFVWVLLPFLFQKLHPYLAWLFDFAVTAGYVALIAYISGNMSWYLPLGLPLVAAVAVAALLFIAVHSTNWGMLNKTAAYFAIFGLLTVMIDFIISGYHGVENPVHWSIFVVIPCIIFAIAFMILERRKKLKDQIRRRLFY